MATAYTNFGGSGARYAVWRLSTTFTLTDGDINAFISGGLTSGPSCIAGQDVAGKEFRFSLTGSPRVVDGFTITQATSGALAPSMKFQGSADGATWTDLTTFDWGTTASFEETFTNTTAYQHYRFVGVSGTFGSQDLYEFEFKTEANSAYEVGDRTSIITITTTSGLPSGGGTARQQLVDGDYGINTSHSWWPLNGQDVAGQDLTFTLSEAQVFSGAYFESWGTSTDTSVTNEGVWKWQGSNDGSTWTDLTDNEYWSVVNYAPEQQGYFPFRNTTSYLYYRMLGISGTTSDKPYFLEVLFDGGTIDTAASVRVSDVQAEVLYTGPPPNLYVSDVQLEVLVSITTAGDIIAPTNVGANDDILEFDTGSPEPTPLELEIDFEEDGLIEVEVNTNVGSVFFAHLTEEDNISFTFVLPYPLSADLVDNSTIDVSSSTLFPTPIVQTIVILTGR